MPYVHFSRSPGVSFDQYLKVVDGLGIEPIAGRQSHWAGIHEGALCTVDIWDDKRDADLFAGERLFPAFEQAGVRPPADTLIVSFQSSGSSDE